MSKDRSKQAAKRAKKKAAGRKRGGIFHPGPMFPTRPTLPAGIEEQQMDALRSSGMFGTPEEFDDALKALEDGGFMDELARGR